MENNPGSMESFEHFIKQQSDEFRMYPTKRVWYSLYNNLHPSRKWPSISMCIVLLTTLFLIGFLNSKNNLTPQPLADKSSANNETFAATIGTNSPVTDISVADIHTLIPGNKSATGSLITGPQAGKSIVSQTTLAKFSKNILQQQATAVTDIQTSKTAAVKETISIVNNEAVSSTPENRQESTTLLLTEGLVTVREKIANNNQSAPKLSEEVSVHTSTVNKLNPDPAASQVTNSLSGNENGLVSSSTENAGLLPSLPVNVEINKVELFVTEAVKTAAFVLPDALLTNPVTLPNTSTVAENSQVNKVDKSWIENYAMYNSPAPKKWKGKLAWQVYFTPSVSYRKLTNLAAGKHLGNSTSSGANLNNESISSQVKQSPSLGAESGIGLQYSLFKGVKIKADLQMNYTRYNVEAYKNSHPTITSLTMISEVNGQLYEVSKNTPYSNNSGLVPATLHSQTLQISLPIGAAIKLAGTNNIEWYAGASIQPTWLVAGKNFLVSTDRRNYVSDKSMLNSFNMNAGFESYISIKTAAGITWQIGPQLRKQLYSTNTKFFSVEEKLVGYGLKIGITKNL